MINNKISKFIFGIAKSYPTALLIMFFTGIMWAFEISFRPYIIKILLNKITDYEGTELFSQVKYIILLYFTGTFLVSSSYRLYDYFVDINMFPKFRQEIVNNCFNLLAIQSTTYYQHNLPGNIANKIKSLTDRIPDILRIIIDKFFSHSLALLIAIYTLWQVSASFAIIMTSWICFFLIIAFFYSRIIAHNSNIWSESRLEIISQLVDIFTNILPIKLFARAKHENYILNKVLNDSVQKERNLQINYIIIFFAYSYSFFLVLGFNMYFLIKGKQENSITIGDFALVMGLNISIGDFLWSLAREFSEFSKIIGEINQALSSILSPPEIEDKKDSVNLQVTNGEIKFDNVCFHYKGLIALFTDLNLTIKSQEKIGLIGYSGSGKTSLVNLILKMHNINSGSILIDSQDINMVSQDSLRENITIITQESYLFNRTIIDNIIYGKLDATKDEVIEAAKKAHAHDFIMNLKDDYNSMIGEKGIKLSGGQKQRISIARAFLKNSPILILDEATSQLDAMTETLIQNALRELMKNRTVIIIAHKLSTLLEMDRILVLYKGRIIEEGNHSELITKNGMYKELWTTQSEGFLVENREVRTEYRP